MVQKSGGGTEMHFRLSWMRNFTPATDAYALIAGAGHPLVVLNSGRPADG